MSGTDSPNSTSASPISDYEWRYEYYDEEEPVSFEGLKAHRYSIVICFWVGLAVFVIFMFFLLTILTKTGASQPDSMAQPCEKRHRLIDYMDTELNNRVRPPHSSGLDSSCSLFKCYVSKEGQLSPRALWTTGRGASGGCHRRPSSSLEGEDGILLQELAVAANRTEKEGILLAHFSIPNCVNSDQSSSVVDNEQLLGDPELPVTPEGWDQSAVNHSDHNDFHAPRKSAGL
ncbi:melanocortin-2 receptor accessory protein 2A [Larimichthys crocea]|uniref:melanocortin-2 receptor accessory protein 2A n=1 Tax=Larimichthys crocea TaxID=215358 RepID=UPI000900C125|nr:melanocortin-2 receptor accessory protein 2A [Larimichthys crocea]